MKQAPLGGGLAAAASAAAEEGVDAEGQPRLRVGRVGGGRSGRGRPGRHLRQVALHEVQLGRGLHHHHVARDRRLAVVGQFT